MARTGPASLLIFGPLQGPTQHPNERWVPAIRLYCQSFSGHFARL